MKTLKTHNFFSGGAKLLGTALSLMFLPGLSQGQILAWQFGAPSPGATGTEVTYNATTTDAHLATSVLSRSNVSIVAAAQARTYVANGFNQASKGNQGFVFNISPQANYMVSLSALNCRIRNTSSTTGSYRWQYSLDGINFTDIGTADVPVPATGVAGVVQASVDLSGTTALHNVTVPITMRIVFWNLAASTSNIGFGRSNSGDTTSMLDIQGTVVPSGPLPVQLQSFDAVASHNDVNLDWLTVKESNSSHFNLERSADGKNFAFIAKVMAKNHPSGARYTYTDYGAIGKGQLYYRLQSVDFDGQAAYSPVAVLNGIKSPGLPMTLYPNPARESFTLVSHTEGAAVLRIFNTMGQQVWEQQLEGGQSKTEINTSTFAKGNYTVQLTVRQTLSTQQLVIQ